jgi:hypothetical protein
MRVPIPILSFSKFRAACCAVPSVPRGGTTLDPFFGAGLLGALRWLAVTGGAGAACGIESFFCFFDAGALLFFREVALRAATGSSGKLRSCLLLFRASRIGRRARAGPLSSSSSATPLGEPSACLTAKPGFRRTHSDKKVSSSMGSQSGRVTFTQVLRFHTSLEIVETVCVSFFRKMTF